MSKAAAEAIRKMIRDGKYTGWTGEPDTRTKDCFMCIALHHNKPVGWTIARDFIEDRLYKEAQTSCLRNLFDKYSEEAVTKCNKKSDYWRAQALEWFENIAVELENLE